MIIEQTKNLKLELTGKDAENFKKGIDAFVMELNKIGYAKIVTDEEVKELFKDIQNKLK